MKTTGRQATNQKKRKKMLVFSNTRKKSLGVGRAGESGVQNCAMWTQSG